MNTQKVEEKSEKQALPQRFVAINEEVSQYKCKLGKACKSKDCKYLHSTHDGRSPAS
jgi:hypothetical protein